jgi:hypothetical protein
MYHKWGEDEYMEDICGKIRKERNHWEDKKVGGWIILKSISDG